MKSATARQAPRNGNARNALPAQDLFPAMRPPNEVFREVRNYLAGQMVGATRDDALLHEVIKCLFVKLRIEQAKSDTPPADDPTALARLYRAQFSTIRKEYPELFTPDEELLLDPRSLDYVIRSLSFSLRSASRDPVGELFQVFAGSESRGGKGQFFTPKNAMDVLVAAVDPRPNELVIDPACGAAGFLAAVIQWWRSNGLEESQVREAARDRLFGVEKDDYLAQLARAHISLTTDVHSRVASGDSLAWTDGCGEPLSVPAAGAYDVVLTNPPFGAKIVAANPEVLRTFELGKKWRFDKSTGEWLRTEMADQAPPQVLFVERCLTLLKQGGRLGIVVPESLISNKSYEYVVAFLKKHARLLAVIGMPESLFKTSGKGGTHTKTCLIVAQRTDTPRTAGHVYMAEARWCGHDSRGRIIPHDDLPKIVEAYAKFRDSGITRGLPLGSCVSYKDVREGPICPRYFDPEIEEMLASLSESHELVTFQKLVDDGTLSLATGDEIGKLAYGTGEIPFVRTSDISSWEIKADPKHLVSEDVYQGLGRKQDIRPLDILMVRDGTYLIGACAIITEYDVKMIYQSHIYKIRVGPNAHGMDAYLLLAILSSPVVQRQVRAKQFTQDIIDSLGGRIAELVLPIPRLAAKRADISRIVKESIEVRVRARELARQARLDVCQP